MSHVPSLSHFQDEEANIKTCEFSSETSDFKEKVQMQPMSLVTNHWHYAYEFLLAGCVSIYDTERGIGITTNRHRLISVKVFSS